MQMLSFHRNGKATPAALARRLWRLIPGRRFPLVRQYEIADCGPAALLSALRALGGDAPFAHVRRLCGTDSSGSTMYDLLVAAQALGLNARGATGDYSALLKEHMPCIAHVITDGLLPHFVVLFRVRAKSVLVGDPGKGLLRISRDEFLAMWKSKVVLLLDPANPATMPPGESLSAWLASHMRGNGPWMTQTVFLGIMTTLLGLFSASSIQIVLDHLIPEKRLSAVVLASGLLGLVVASKAGLGYFRQKFITIAGRTIAERISSEFLNQIFHLPKEFFLRRRTGDITSRFGDAAKVQQALARVLSSAFLDVFVLAGSLALLAYYSTTMFWCTFAVIPVCLPLMLQTMRRVTDTNHEVLASYARVESGYIDALNGIDEILNKNCADHFSRTSGESFSRFQASVQGLGFLQAKLSFMAELCSGVLSFALLMFGSLLVIDGSLRIGQMMAAFSLSTFAFPSMLRLVEAGVVYNGAAIAIQRLRDICQTDREQGATGRSCPAAAGLEIRHGTFGWNRRTMLFDGVSFSLDRGTLTALWGPSGSGKSTLADILLRKIPLTSGTILVDGIAAEEFSLQSYREKIALVPQEPKIFHATILDNILLGSSGMPPVDLCGLVRNLGLDRFFERFPGGANAVPGENGLQLSWGERQIVALLRALVRKPEILIVDEGLTGLDAGLEEGVKNYLRRYSREHGVLLITHDRDTIAMADRVYVLSSGTMSTPLSRTDALARVCIGAEI
ncbi:MAG TPA: peptidase domain-containing ABC transporter [Bacteroidota bacterium]|nr:peptidase domain-containing ABC transporter [Bacteroidota bacterium]